MTASGILPIAAQILSEPGTKFIFHFMSFLLKWRGGKRKEADSHLMEAHRLLLEDRKDERRVTSEETERWRQHSFALVDRLAVPLRDAVAPVGRSSETLSLAGPPGEAATVIDAPMAEAIRC